MTGYEIGAPPAIIRVTIDAYDRGYAWAEYAINKYGNEACAKFRKSQVVKSAYDQGAADAFDGKANRYGK